MKILFLVCFVFLSSHLFAQDIPIENNQLVFNESIDFKNNTATITEKSKLVLTKIRPFLLHKASISTLRIESHVANATTNNQTLSQQRAKAIAMFLIQDSVDCKKLIAVGFGNTKPIVDNSTTQGKKDNTRIVFVIAALRNKAIGGMPIDGGGIVVANLCK